MIPRAPRYLTPHHLAHQDKWTLSNVKVGLNPAFAKPRLLNKAFPTSGELGGQIQFGC